KEGRKGHLEKTGRQTDGRLPGSCAIGRTMARDGIFHANHRSRTALFGATRKGPNTEICSPRPKRQDPLGLTSSMFAEAGSTLFSRGRNLETALGVRTIHLKFEGSNPTGTQKDRIARHCYDEAHAQGFDTITVATCGNFGASVAWACSHNGIRPTVFVPSDYHTPRIVEMETLGARIIRVPGDYE